MTGGRAQLLDLERVQQLRGGEPDRAVHLHRDDGEPPGELGSQRVGRDGGPVVEPRQRPLLGQHGRKLVGAQGPGGEQDLAEAGARALLLGERVLDLGGRDRTDGCQPLSDRRRLDSATHGRSL